MTVHRGYLPSCLSNAYYSIIIIALIVVNILDYLLFQKLEES